jgi:hypothetical protein
MQLVETLALSPSGLIEPGQYWRAGVPEVLRIAARGSAVKSSDYPSGPADFGMKARLAATQRSGKVSIVSVTEVRAPNSSEIAMP